MSQAKWRGNRCQIPEMIRTHVGSLDSAISFWTFGGPWLTEEISMVSLHPACPWPSRHRRVNHSPGVLLDVQREHHLLQHVVKHLRGCQGSTAHWMVECIQKNMLMLWLHPPESQLYTFEDIFQNYKIGYTQHIFQTPLLVLFSNWVRLLYGRRMVWQSTPVDAGLRALKSSWSARSATLKPNDLNGTMSRKPPIFGAENHEGSPSQRMILMGSARSACGFSGTSWSSGETTESIGGWVCLGSSMRQASAKDMPAWLFEENWKMYRIQRVQEDLRSQAKRTSACLSTSSHRSHLPSLLGGREAKVKGTLSAQHICHLRAKHGATAGFPPCAGLATWYYRFQIAVVNYLEDELQKASWPESDPGSAWWICLPWFTLQISNHRPLQPAEAKAPRCWWSAIGGLDLASARSLHPLSGVERWGWTHSQLIWALGSNPSVERYAWCLNMIWLVVLTCFNHLEKYESMGRMTSQIYEMENNSLMFQTTNQG